MKISNLLSFVLICSLTVCLNTTSHAAEKKEQAGQNATSTPTGSTGENNNPQATQSLSDIERIEKEINVLYNSVSGKINQDLNELARDKEAFMTEYTKAKTQKESLDTELKVLQEEYELQIFKLTALQAEASAQESSRNALEGAARINANHLLERLEYEPIGHIPSMDMKNLDMLAHDKEYPSFNSINTLLSTQMEEIKLSAKITKGAKEVSLPDGTTQSANVLRFGSFFSVAQLNSGEIIFLKPTYLFDDLMTAPSKLDTASQEVFNNYFNGINDFIVADFSKGLLFNKAHKESTFIDHILNGGTLVWPILFIGLLASLYGLWRIIGLFSVRFGSQDVLDTLFDYVEKGEFERAKELLEAQKGKSKITYSFLSYMLSHWNKTLLSLEKAYEEAFLIYLSPLEKGLSFIAVAATVAPLLGLLGTVTGMISTFDVITLHGNSDPKLLSGGISIALVTTEVGLMVAIPLMFLHFILARRLEVIEKNLDTKGTMCIARVSNFLGEKEQGR